MCFYQNLPGFSFKRTEMGVQSVHRQRGAKILTAGFIKERMRLVQEFNIKD